MAETEQATDRSATRRGGAPQLPVRVAGTLLLTLLLLVAPAFWRMQRSFEAALVQDRIEVIRKAHDAWTARLNDRLVETEASAARFARLLDAELERPRGDPAAFDDLVALDPDGAWRSRPERFDPARDAGVFLPPTYPLDDAERVMVLAVKRLIERYQTGTSADFTDTWALPRQGGVVIHWPSLPGFVRELPPSMDYTTTDWMTLASPARNPERRPRWTPTLYDAGARVWMITVVAPFHRGGEFAGSIGHDVPINDLLSRIGDLVLAEGTEYHVARADGTLLLSSAYQPHIKATGGTFSIASAGDVDLAAAFAAARTQPGDHAQVIRGEGDPRPVIAARLLGPDWVLLSVVPRASLLAAARAPYRSNWLILFAAVVAMVLLPVLMLARVLFPSVRGLVEGAERIRAGALDHRFALRGSREFVRISEALNAMIARLHDTLEERRVAQAALEEKEAHARALLAERERDEQELRRRLAVIEQQQEAIRSMATPIIQVWDEVLALPVVGVLDSDRAAIMMQSLLDAITAQRARVAILDLTGVATVDDTTADHVVRMLRAVRLLGVEGIVTGLQSDVARRMVALGVDMSGITTLATLREAIHASIRARAANAGR